MSQEIKNNYYEEAITELKKHAEVANSEMNAIQIDMAVVKNDMGYIKTDLSTIKPKLDEMHGTMRYWMGGLAVIMIGITLLSKLL